MGLLKKLFALALLKEIWYKEGHLSFKHGARVEIIGVSDDMRRHSSRVGVVVGLTKSTKCVYLKGRYNSLQRLFLIDLGGMVVEVPGFDLELMEALGCPKDGGLYLE